MKPILSKCVDDFLDGSDTVYNYDPPSVLDFLFYAQIAGIQKIGNNYYNEVAYAKDYQIQYTIDGEGDAIINGIHYTISKGDILVIPNFIHHIFRPIPGKNWEIAFIHIFDNHFVAKTYEYLMARQGFFFHGIYDTPILARIQTSLRLLHEDPVKNAPDISAEIYAMLMYLTGLASQKHPETRRGDLSGVLRYIQQYYNTPIKLQDILQYFHYSKNHLERLFKDEMHMTIQQYISSLRLKKAEELISTSSYTFKEIAHMIGLNDYRSLVYLFQKTIHMTPTAYQHMINERYRMAVPQNEKVT